jgi:hypothetical protein
MSTKDFVDFSEFLQFRGYGYNPSLARQAVRSLWALDLRTPQ